MELPDGSYSIEDIQDYFEFIIKKHETLTENPPVQIHPNKIKNIIVFNVKTGYKLELLPSETMKLLGTRNKGVDQSKDGEDVPKLETVFVFEVALVHCKPVNNNFQQAQLSRRNIFTFISFVQNKQFGQLINISPCSSTMVKTINTEVSSIEVWFTD